MHKEFIASLPDVTTYNNTHVTALCRYKHLKVLKEQVEEWFKNIPSSEQADLAARLRSKDDGQHLGAFYELMLHQFCLEEGWQINLHKAINSKLKPDINIKTEKGKKFLLEIATQLDEQEYRTADKRKKELDNAIAEINTPYVLSLHYGSYPPEGIKVKELVKYIETWLKNLPNTSNKEFECDLLDKAVDLRINARLEKFKPKNGCIYFISGPGVTGLPGVEKVKNTLAKKRKKYSSAKTNLPLVIAICDGTSNLMHDETVIDRALYGNVTISFSINSEVDEQPTTGRDNSGFITPHNGFLSQPENKGISAVLYVSRVQKNPGEITYKMLLLHNPWAYLPLDTGIFKWIPQLVVTKNDETGVKLEWNKKDHENFGVYFPE